MIATSYERLGGDAAVRNRVDRSYDLMDRTPEARGIRVPHPPEPGGSREKLHLFLSGWLGGPPLYAKRFGHPMLRARHQPFTIGPAERDLWMQCMYRALDDTVSDSAMRRELGAAFTRLAEHLRNDSPSPILASQP